MRVEGWVIAQFVFFAWIVRADWRHQRIPVLALCGVVIANVGMYGVSTVSVGLMVALLVLMDGVCWVRSRPYLPLADKILLLVLANMVPVSFVPFVLMSAGIAGGLLGVCLKKTGRLTPYPFAPVAFLSWAGLLYTCQGDQNALELKSGLMFF